MNYNFNELKMLLEKCDVGDTIIIPYNGKEKKFVVLGRNINPNIGENVDYDFIDIMSKELLIPVGTQWKKEIPVVKNPWYASLKFTESDIIKELHSRLELFPREIQDIVVSKKERFFVRIGRSIASKSEYDIFDIGKVWLPSDQELFNNSTMNNSDPRAKQYPYFKKVKNRKFGNSYWWTCSARAFWDYEPRKIEAVNPEGYPDTAIANSSNYGAPLCIRLRIS